MTGSDDAKRLGLREGALAMDLQRIGHDAPVGSPSVLARTKEVGTYPTPAKCFYACSPVTLLGTDVEGGVGAFTEAPSTFYALNLGVKSPPLGTYILVTFVNNRWVFRYDA